MWFLELTLNLPTYGTKWGSAYAMEAYRGHGEGWEGKEKQKKVKEESE
jgi:hypothetical protein